MGALTSSLGFPRMGPHRELKSALESHWRGDLDVDGLQAVASDQRRRTWQLHHDRGFDHVPSGDFSLYDHVLDTALMVDAIPQRHRHTGSDQVPDPLAVQFAMARGGHLGGRDVTPLEMTKWFDTNYHYLVPEIAPGQSFALDDTRVLDQYREATDQGVDARPVLLGPVTFLLLSRHAAGVDPLARLDDLVDVYCTLLERLGDAGAAWVQLDEPALGLDVAPATWAAAQRTYARLGEAAGDLQVLLATYFTGLRDGLEPALALPIDGLHLDAVTDPDQLDRAAALAPDDLTLSVGIVDGRNVWRTDLDNALSRLEAVGDKVGLDRIMVAPSCSLLHLPDDLDREPDIDDELRSWLAFATQRLDEVATLTRGLNDGREAVAEELQASTAAVRSRAASTRVHDERVRARMADHDPSLEHRPSPYVERRVAQAERLDLPLLPTTTIGSFPQTAGVRRLRAEHRRGEVDDATYVEGMRQRIRDTVAFQEDVGLDVLVHGEPERNDMVEYFGELLEGTTVTRHGWVQSYGSRCVKPPIIHGDVHRPAPMTVEWIEYAQSLTERPLKGMLTGPITILEWSFVRNDQPRAQTGRQLAFAIRDEVADLEAAGIGIIQVDEPALREGLPLRAEDHAGYLDWAVGAFRLATSGVADATQVHTHMCYADFNEVIEAIAALDADVISIEASRSDMTLLSAFVDFNYPNEIGPGVYDIHSPRVPTVDEMAGLLTAAAEVIPVESLWVNPDCGLKTRTWDQVRPALTNLVAAANQVRAKFE